MHLFLQDQWHAVTQEPSKQEVIDDNLLKIEDALKGSTTRTVQLEILVLAHLKVVHPFGQLILPVRG